MHNIITNFALKLAKIMKVLEITCYLVLVNCNFDIMAHVLVYCVD